MAALEIDYALGSKHHSSVGRIFQCGIDLDDNIIGCPTLGVVGISLQLPIHQNVANHPSRVCGSAVFSPFENSVDVFVLGLKRQRISLFLVGDGNRPHCDIQNWIAANKIDPPHVQGAAVSIDHSYEKQREETPLRFLSSGREVNLRVSVPHEVVSLPPCFFDLLTHYGNREQGATESSPAAESPYPSYQTVLCAIANKVLADRISKDNYAANDANDSWSKPAHDLIWNVGHTPSLPRITLDTFHPSKQLNLEVGSTGAGMCSAMAVWAKSDHSPWVIWSAIAYSMDVVRFEVRLTIFAKEGRRRAVIFAFAFGSTKHPIADIFAPFIDVSFPIVLGFSGLRLCGRESSGLEFLIADSRLCGALRPKLFIDIFEWSKMEDDSLAHLLIGTWCLAFVEALAHVFSEEAIRTLYFLEEQEAFAVRTMFEQAAIAIPHFHRAIPASPKVVIAAVRHQNVMVSVLFATFARYGDYYFVGSRCDDAALSLASELLMNIFFSVVALIPLEAPAHIPSSQIPLANVVDQTDFDRVKRAWQ